MAADGIGDSACPASCRAVRCFRKAIEPAVDDRNPSSLCGIVRISAELCGIVRNKFLSHAVSREWRGGGERTVLVEGASGSARACRPRHDGPRCPGGEWSVTGGDYPVEAQLENAATGVCHGYPMPETDPFRDVVLKRWSGR